MAAVWLGTRTASLTSCCPSISTAGIAYVAHKAASPIRFPPTVALTPIVCRSVETERFGSLLHDSGRYQ